jgi:glyoxalase family protein
MPGQIIGLHHITAIAGSVQANYDFYTRVLGLRMVKKTVNFDDPATYHFYYGNKEGTPGTILTFFPWEGIGPGKPGVGMATEIGYTVNPDHFDFWENRFREFKVKTGDKMERFGELYLPFSDPDGLFFTLVSPAKRDERKGWETPEVKEAVAIKGFYNTTLTLGKMNETAKVLTDILGYRLLSQEGNRYRFITDAISTACTIDLLEDPGGKRGRNTAGTNHHIAFRVADENTQMAYREKVLEKGLQITPKINRDYFYSVYFREPGGVLFEIATDNPGFTIDEPLAELGSNLKLPKQFEPSRKEIEGILPKLKQ